MTMDTELTESKIIGIDTNNISVNFQTGNTFNAVLSIGVLVKDLPTLLFFFF
jgi:endo-1,4-beta-mannosidase